MHVQQPHTCYLYPQALALLALGLCGIGCGADTSGNDGQETTDPENAGEGGLGGAAPAPSAKPGAPPPDLWFDSNADNGGDVHTEAVDVASAPAFAPKLLVNTIVGGAGNQFIRRVFFKQDGSIVGVGNGFEVVYDAEGSKGTISGDPNTNDEHEFRGNSKPNRIGNEVSDGRNGQTYKIGYRQVGGNLQQPFLEAGTTWKFWGWKESEVGDLRADSRGYDISFMPNGLIMALAWTDGGNSTLTRDPQNLKAPLKATEGAIMSSAGGLATLYLLIDPALGRPLSGTFLYTQSMNRAVDRYGRVYITDRITKNTTPTNPFSQPDEARAGFIVLTPDLKKAALNIKLGANCAKPERSTFASVAVRKNILVLGGTTCSSAPIVATANAVQSDPGGDQDGYLAIISLW